jgi:hypothetical protein
VEIEQLGPMRRDEGAVDIDGVDEADGVLLEPIVDDREDRTFSLP